MFSYRVSYLNSQEFEEPYNEINFREFQANVVKLSLGAKNTIVPGEIYYDYSLTNNHNIDLYFDLENETIYLVVGYYFIFNPNKKRHLCREALFGVVKRFDDYIRVDYSGLPSNAHGIRRFLLTALGCYTMEDLVKYSGKPKYEDAQKQKELEEQKLKEFRNFVSTMAWRIYYDGNRPISSEDIKNNEAVID